MNLYYITTHDGLSAYVVSKTVSEAVDMIPLTQRESWLLPTARHIKRVALIASTDDEVVGSKGYHISAINRYREAIDSALLTFGNDHPTLQRFFADIHSLGFARPIPRSDEKGPHLMAWHRKSPVFCNVYPYLEGLRRADATLEIFSPPWDDLLDGSIDFKEYSPTRRCAIYRPSGALIKPGYKLMITAAVEDVLFQALALKPSAFLSLPLTYQKGEKWKLDL